MGKNLVITSLSSCYYECRRPLLYNSYSSLTIMSQCDKDSNISRSVKVMKYHLNTKQCIQGWPLTVQSKANWLHLIKYTMSMDLTFLWRHSYTKLQYLLIKLQESLQLSITAFRLYTNVTLGVFFWECHHSVYLKIHSFYVVNTGTLCVSFLNLRRDTISAILYSHSCHVLVDALVKSGIYSVGGLLEFQYSKYIWWTPLKNPSMSSSFMVYNGWSNVMGRLDLIKSIILVILS